MQSPNVDLSLPSNFFLASWVMQLSVAKGFGPFFFQYDS